MASITYSITVSPQDTIFKGGGTFTARLTRNSAPPSGATPTSAVIKFTKIHVWSKNYPYIKFEDYFTTDGLPNTSGEFLEVNCSSFSSNILNISSATITATVKGVSSSVNAFDFDSSSVTLVVEYDEAASYGASTGYLSETSVEAGKTIRIDISNINLSNLSHNVTWKLGAYSNSSTLSAGTSSTSFTVPLDWINAIPNSTTATGTVTLQTLNGSTLLGTKTYDFTVSVPSSVVPTFTSQTATRIDNTVPVSWDMYIQGISGVQLTVDGANGIYGSSISKYNFSGGTSGVSSENVLTVQTITGNGILTFTATVTDSRGRTSSPKSVSINVTTYSSPSFTSVLAYRCTSSGTSNGEGKYIGARAEFTYSNVGLKNSASLSCYYQRTGDQSWTLGETDMVSNVESVFGDGNIDTDYSYRVRFVLTDTLGTVVERIANVSTTQYTMFFKEGGAGVAVGKVCENEYSFEINPDWSIRYGSYQLRPVYFGSQPSNPVEGLIWLEPVT